MKIYNTATEVIKQGGARRGANMGILRIDHPDILDFIKIKRSEGELTNFNISVAVTDAFMDALQKDEEYELVNPRSRTSAGRIGAKVVFDAIVESAWEIGDPGIVFIDRINRANPTPHMGTMESTNPCGEQPLLPYEACILGSLNLPKYVNKSILKDSTFTFRSMKEDIDLTNLAADIKTSVCFLDDAIDVNKYPLPEIEKMHKGNRKIGLGVMGWADMLILLGIPYNSEEALDLAKKIMRFINEQGHQASRDLAKSRGAFPHFLGSVYEQRHEPPIRNATVTTIAPTGTISIIANTSSGVEPIFAVSYVRQVMVDDILVEVHPRFEQIAREREFYSPDLMKRIAEHGSIQ